ncbi:hypothetical protein EDD91_5783 [Streptomyces sp. KS 21]|nr:hypothetical protein EDD91_5783 [Streptomyces sp. KS 21]
MKVVVLICFQSKAFDVLSKERKQLQSTLNL